MRRADREVKEFNEITDILSRCDTIRLGLNGGEYPYVVPLSFGFEVIGQAIVFYIHGAKEGLKHDLIAKDNRVCVEASIFHEFTEVPEHNTVTTQYESFIGFGKAEKVIGQAAVRGLDLICEQAGFKGFDYGGERALDAVTVYKIEIASFTGKRRLAK